MLGGERVTMVELVRQVIVFKPDKCRTVNYSEVKWGGGKGGGVSRTLRTQEHTFSSARYKPRSSGDGFLCEEGRGLN